MNEKRKINNWLMIKCKTIFHKLVLMCGTSAEVSTAPVPNCPWSKVS